MVATCKHGEWKSFRCDKCFAESEFEIVFSNGDRLPGGKTLRGTKQKATRLAPRKQSVKILKGSVLWASRSKWSSRDGTEYETWGWMNWVDK